MSIKTDNLKRKQQIDDDLMSRANPKIEENKKMKMDEINQYLMPLHVVTCGLQGVDLGRDETAIIQICVTLIDIAKKEIIGERSLILQASSLLDPEADPEKIHISIPAREMTGLFSIPNQDSQIDLRQALLEIDNFISSLTSTGDAGEAEIIPVTVGHLPLRSVVHREARFRNINLAKYWYSYFDLCDQMSLCYQQTFSSMKDISSVLQILHSEVSVSIIYNMSQTVLFLLKYGHNFRSIHNVTTNYRPKVFHVNDPIDEDVVVVIKPIDYKTPISQVLPFFNGVNIADGGVAIIMSDGRRSNKICVRLVDKTQRDIALLRDKHHLEPGSTRYITMSTFESQEFMKMAGYEDDNVKDYLIRLTNQDQVLIRMKGLPFTVTKDDIFNFFKSHDTEIEFDMDGIFLVQRPSGDLNGDSFIIFSNDIEASKATNLKGSMIGNRYVEIFHSTPAEMNQVIAGIKSGSNVSKFIKKSIKGRELENSDGLQNPFQVPLGLLNGSLIQNMLCNKTDLMGGAIVISYIPSDATDIDFIKFLAEFRSSCISISRQNLNNPKGYVSYVARFKDTYDSELALKSLANKPFKIDLVNKEFPVNASNLPLNGASLYKTIATHSPLFQKSPLNTINMVPSVFQMMQPSFNINPSIQMSNGPFLNYGVIPNPYSFNQYNQLSLLSNALQSNFLGNQITPQFSIQPPMTNSYMTPADVNINVNNNNFLVQKLPMAPAIAQTMLIDKASIVMMYGVQIQLLQHDLDSIFSSLIPYISTLPKLYQVNQLFYAIFSSSEDAKIALSRCPIILYKNQTIYLFSIN